MTNHLSERDVTVRSSEKMKREMDQVWADFFEKNPEEKEDVVKKWIEKRLRGKGRETQD